MNPIFTRKPSAQVEPLEQRIAPAVLTDLAPVVLGTPILLDADPGTSAPAGITLGLNGAPLIFVEKGSCLVFTKDLNGNNIVDFNEITGIAAGDGLRMIAFVDIHGDIVTNLRPDGTLTDSDGIAANGRDGQILLNNKIESIELRSVRQDEIPVGTLLTDKIALSSYSIFGNIYAGGGFGTLDGGLLIDASGASIQEARFSGGETAVWVETKPQIGSIRVGSAASGRFFSFGASISDDAGGQLGVFTPPSGAAGADIINVRTANPNTQFNLGTLQAGDGGFNGRGGDIVNAIISGDTSGGYGLIAGNAGPGPTGQRGGNIENWVDLGSITSEVVIKTGNGGQGLVGRGGNGGSVTFGDILPIDNDNDPSTPPIVPDSAASVTGRVKITLGNGGAGLTGGGDGGSFPTGKFTPLEPLLAYPLKVASTWHRPGDIGQLISVDDLGNPLPATDGGYHAIRGIDFDGDGANDIVYTSAQNNGNQGGQLIVVFGNPTFDPTPDINTPLKDLNSTDPDRTLFLDAPDNPEALTIGDFNNDGKPDIAVASGNANAGGVQVIMSMYDPLTGNFVGFSDAVYSPLPALGGLVPFSYVDPQKGLYRSAPHATKIFELASGDFDGDGSVDLGVMGELAFYMLRGDVDQGPNGTVASPTGHFFSDTVSNFGIVPADNTGDVLGEFPVIKASSLRDGGNASFAIDPATNLPRDHGRDILFANVQGTRNVSAYQYNGAVLLKSGVSLGRVDTNREVSDAGKTDKISLTDANAKDFTFLDVNRDGRAEISILTSSPEGFLVNKSDSDGLPNALFETTISDRFSGTGTISADDNRGIRIGGRGGPSNFGLELSDGGLVGMLTHTLLVGGQWVTSVAVVDYEVHPDNLAPITNNILQFTPQPAVVPPNESASYFGVTVRATQQFGFNNADQSIRAFDSYIPFAPGRGPTDAPTSVSLLLGLPTKDAPFPPHVPLIESLYNIEFLDRNGFLIRAGDGGDSANGPGGKGGSIGNTLRFDSVTGQAIGSFDITLPSFPQFFATVRIVAGNGGDGFRDGGLGGTVTGLSVRHAIGTTLVTNSGLLIAGDGGNSVKGKGGKGGDVKSVFIEGGDLFFAGSGGNGVIGGAGGSVIGNSFGLADTTAVEDRGDIDNVEGVQVAVFAGRGGSGVRQGGTGGDILGFTPLFKPNLGSNLGLYHLRAGDGGNSTIGTGGRGGNVFDSSPNSTENFLTGSIFVMAGKGGNGTKGGNGGAIQNFVNESTGGQSPLSTTFLAGAGGIGTAGAGGTGGSITNVRINGTGVGFQFYFDFTDRENFEFLEDAITTSVVLPLSRMVAGEGGTSLGGTGGNGGNLLNVVATATTSTFALAAGRGGDGLMKGGLGGSITHATATAGSQDVNSNVFGVLITKPQVLVIAGEGGDAFSGVARKPQDPLVPGKKLPTAGGGGSIIDFHQESGTDVNIQLIAGNGGNTPNAGSTTDVKSKVGRGGSIQDVFVVGRIGDTGDPADGTGAPIKAYNPILPTPNPDPTKPDVNDPIDDRMSYFVKTRLIGNPEDSTVPLSLVNGDTGNVGIVVGAKGRVHDGNNDGQLDPAPDVGGSVPNGSLINVRASHIMSAVAGHVERIASIQVLKNVAVTTIGGEYGSDRFEDTLGRDASKDGHVFTIGPDGFDYLRADGTWSSTPVIGGSLVDGAIVAKTSRTPQSDRDFKIG